MLEICDVWRNPTFKLVLLCFAINNNGPALFKLRLHRQQNEHQKSSFDCNSLGVWGDPHATYCGNMWQHFTRQFSHKIAPNLWSTAACKAPGKMHHVQLYVELANAKSMATLTAYERQTAQKSHDSRFAHQSQKAGNCGHPVASQCLWWARLRTNVGRTLSSNVFRGLC